VGPIFIATAEGLHVVSDGKLRVELEGHEVTALTAQGRTLWAVVDGMSLRRRAADGGWSEVAAIEGLTGRCLLASGAELLVGTSGARLFRLQVDSLRPEEGFDQVEGRDGWYTPWGGPPDTRSLSRSEDGRLFANVHVGGIPRSADGGRTWEPTIDVDTDVHQVLASDGSVFAALGDAGLAVSDDGGDGWRTFIDGLHAAYCRAVAAGDGAVYVSASESHVGRRAAVYRAELGTDLRFEKCTSGLPEWFDANVDTGWLAASEEMVAVGGPDGSVFLSRDRGATFRIVAEGLPSLRWLLLSPG
jgi:hypothetical protein